MEEIVKISSIAQYNSMRGVPTQHPLVAVIELIDKALMECYIQTWIPSLYQ
ncbi:hypothetical protein [Spirosoma koreense]